MAKMLLEARLEKRVFEANPQFDLVLPEPAEVIEYAEYGYPESVPEYRELFAYVEKKSGRGLPECRGLVSLLHNDLTMDITVKHVLEYNKEVLHEMTFSIKDRKLAGLLEKGQDGNQDNADERSQKERGKRPGRKSGYRHKENLSERSMSLDVSVIYAEGCEIGSVRQVHILEILTGM